MTAAPSPREGRRLRTTGYGALAGGLVGTALTVALSAAWAVNVFGEHGSRDAAFATTALLSGVMSFPALFVLPADAVPGGSLFLAQALVIVLLLVTWLAVGALSGAIVDVVRLWRP